jgi:TolB-like protein
MENKLCFSIILSILILSAGCTGGRDVKFHRSAEIGEIKRVAVLPFENLTSEKEAAKRIRRTVIAELLSRSVDVIEPGEVTRVLRELEVRTTTALSIEDIQKIGKELKVDALITGSVIAYRISRGINVSYPEVTIQLMLIDTETGNILWSVWNTEGGPDFWVRHFGTEGKSLSETARDVVKKAFDTLF